MKRNPVRRDAPCELLKELRAAYIAAGEPPVDELAAAAKVDRKTLRKRLSQNTSDPALLATERILRALGKRIVVIDA